MHTYIVNFSWSPCLRHVIGREAKMLTKAKATQLGLDEIFLHMVGLFRVSKKLVIAPLRKVAVNVSSFRR